MMRGLSALLLILAGFFGASAQQATGIRFLAIEAESISPRWHYQFLIGVDRQVADRLAIGLDIIKNVEFEAINESLDNGSYQSSGYYSLTRSIWGMQYRSQYFMTEAAYIGPTIGMRKVRLQQNLEMYNWVNNVGYPVTLRGNGETTLYPIGLRLGLRTEMDGWYQDLYVAIGMLAGGKDLRKLSLIDKDKLNNTWINVGYSIGIGW